MNPGIKIELIYDDQCPNVEPTRDELRKALEVTGLPKKWQEWDRNSKDSPQYTRKYGSPTILVNSKDVSGLDATSDENCCRLYSSRENKMTGVPPAGMISKALSKGKPNRGGWLGLIGAMPTTVVALIPTFTCPSCWPFYLGLIGTVGISSYDFTDSLVSMMVCALAISLTSLAYRAKQRHGYRPLLIGILASALLLMGKVWFENSLLTYSGAVLLIIASVWNSLTLR